MIDATLANTMPSVSSLHVALLVRFHDGARRGCLTGPTSTSTTTQTVSFLHCLRRKQLFDRLCLASLAASRMRNVHIPEQTGDKAVSKLLVATHDLPPSSRSNIFKTVEHTVQLGVANRASVHWIESFSEVPL